MPWASYRKVAPKRIRTRSHANFCKLAPTNTTTSLIGLENIYYAVVLTCLIFALLLLAWRIAARVVSRKKAQKRTIRARRGEILAEQLLQQNGYTILARQKALRAAIRCNNRPHFVELRADLVVERNNKRYVAEVKTGQIAPLLSNSATTRRQLLEYWMAYDIDNVLLIRPSKTRTSTKLNFPMFPDTPT